MADEGSPVKVYIYDISMGLARSMSQMFLGKQIDGIWHTGIVVFGREYFFGGLTGIESCPPCGTVLGNPQEIFDLGKTQIPKEMFIEYLRELSTSSFTGSTYHLLEHNCNSFSSEVAQFLTGKDIPSHITNLPSEVLSTPFGQMIKPYIDSMSVNPSGGSALFADMSTPSQPQNTPSAQPNAAATQSTASSSTTVAQPSTETAAERSPICRLFPLDKLPSISDNSLSSADCQILKDIQEYLSTKDCSWSLGRNHIQVIDKLLNNRQHQDSLCQYVQGISASDDGLGLILNDSTHTILNILDRYPSLDATSKNALSCTVINISRTKDGHSFVTSETHVPNNNDKTASSMLSDICVGCLLESVEHGDIINTGAAICYNLSRTMISNDLMVELSSALLQVLQTNSDEETVFYSLIALSKFAKGSQEVKALISIMEVDWDRIKSISNRNKNLTETILQLTSL